MPLGNEIGQVAVCCTNDLHIDRNGVCAAKRRNRSIFENAQEMGLKFKRHIADFVEEQSAAVARENFTRPAAFHAARKRAGRVAEEFACQECGGDRGAVDRNVRLLCALAFVVQRSRQRILAHARFAEHEQWNILVDDLAAQADVLDHQRISSRDTVKRADLASRVLPCAFVVQSLRGAARARGGLLFRQKRCNKCV